ncbi:hypothetical protein D9M72_439430 [compost metagenome]
MMQQRGAGHGKLGDQPPLEDIAEIDDSVRDRPAGCIGLAHHIVVCDIMMDRLDAQFRRDGLQTPHGSDHDLGDPLLALLVRHVGEKMKHDGTGAAQVPLQFPFKPGMFEVLQRRGQPPGQRAERGNGFTREMLAPGQRLAIEKIQQANPVVLVADGNALDRLAPERGHHFRNTRQSQTLGKMPQGRILGLQFERPIFRAADLQHIASLAGIDAIVAVLLAAEFADRA